jgi:hypothetical protein
MPLYTYDKYEAITNVFKYNLQLLSDKIDYSMISEVRGILNKWFHESERVKTAKQFINYHIPDCKSRDVYFCPLNTMVNLQKNIGYGSGRVPMTTIRNIIDNLIYLKDFNRVNTHYFQTNLCYPNQNYYKQDMYITSSMNNILRENNDRFIEIGKVMKDILIECELMFNLC